MGYMYVSSRLPLSPPPPLPQSLSPKTAAEKASCYSPNAVDGLTHLGGWAMGILCGIILYPAITETKRRKYVVWGCRVVAVALIIMAMVMTIKNFCMFPFPHSRLFPLKEEKEREKKRRDANGIGADTDDPNKACEWCKYLSCIPTSSNDRCTGTVRLIPRPLYRVALVLEAPWCDLGVKREGERKES